MMMQSATSVSAIVRLYTKRVLCSLIQSEFCCLLVLTHRGGGGGSGTTLRAARFWDLSPRAVDYNQKLYSIHMLHLQCGTADNVEYNKCGGAQKFFPQVRPGAEANCSVVVI